MNVLVVAIVVIYLIAMLGIGYYSSKKVKSNEDFVLAGRRLGPILLAGTLAATEIGGGSSLGVVEKSYGSWGLSASWYVIAMGIAFIILSIFAPKLRRAEVKTVPEYFRRRYGKSSGLITTLIMMIPLIGLTAVQFIASATILSIMLGMSYAMAVTIVAIVVTIYAIMGGLWSVTLTDFVQVFLIVIGMALAIPFSLSLAGGMNNVVANVPKGTFNMFKGISPSTIIALIVMYIASFSVGQEAVSRLYAAKDEKTAVQGSIISAIINLVFAFIPTILGIITLALVNMGKIDNGIILQGGAKYALPYLAMNTMPAIVVGILFAGIISATMSSADSDLLGAGAIFGNEVYKVYLNKDADNINVMKVTKITMAIIGILAYLFALFNTGSIINVLMFAFSLRAAGAFFPYIIGLYWKKASAAGTIASLILGSVALIILERTGYQPLGLEPILWALPISLISFFAFSKLIPPANETLEMIPEEKN
ncbi:MAG: sodium:solute symporter family protein [Spirochaetaceae bacterium]|nr:sodium:solute symporter family protein [Spirochaetaceae bacterium]